MIDDSRDLLSRTPSPMAYSLQSTKKKIKYYEIFLLEKKISQPNQFFNITLLCFLFLFFFSQIGLLELASRM